MNPSAAAEALGSAENKSSSPKSNIDQAESQESNSKVPTIETYYYTFIRVSIIHIVKV